MVEANVIPARQFKDANYMWGQNAIPTLWAWSTLYMGEGNVIHAQQFLNAHCMWGQNAIPTLWT